MPNQFFARTVMVSLLALVGMNLGCGGEPPVRTAPSPPPNPPAATLRVAALFPNSGVVGGATPVKILGAGFQSGATVTFDGASASVTAFSTSALTTSTPVHSAGAVDVVVTNPDGQVERLPGAYTYASPRSFDFNGAWEGHALAHPDLTHRHSDMDLRFTIDNNMVTSVTCGGSALTLSPPPSVHDGAFSLAGEDAVVLSGRIVSDGGAVGTINTDACPITRWAATKR